MMKMKKSLPTWMLAVALLTLSACEKADSGNLNYGTITYPLGTHERSYGADNTPYVLRDDGVQLKIKESHVPKQYLTEGRRVIAQYVILDDATPPQRSAGPIYNIRLNYLYDVLCKEPVHKTSEPDPAAFGKDPIEIYRAWLGGMYLNIEFDYASGLAGHMHYINLWLDDTDLSQKTWVAEFRHDAKGDHPVYNSSGRVSFDLKALYESYGTPSQIKLKYTGFWGSSKEVVAGFMISADDQPYRTDADASYQ